MSLEVILGYVRVAELQPSPAERARVDAGDVRVHWPVLEPFGMHALVMPEGAEEDRDGRERHTEGHVVFWKGEMRGECGERGDTHSPCRARRRSRRRR